MFYENTDTGAFGITFYDAASQVNASIPEGTVQFGPFWGYENSAPPTYDPITQSVREAAPVNHVQQWEVYALTPEQAAANQEAYNLSVRTECEAGTQQRLDDFARTRMYDGITAACTYATSTNATFAAEGQYCVQARDATWETLYQIFADVDAGLRPMPTSYAEIEPELPPLAWP